MQVKNWHVKCYGISKGNQSVLYIIINETTTTYYTIPQLFYVINFFIWSCDTAIPYMFIGKCNMKSMIKINPVIALKGCMNFPQGCKAAYSARRSLTHSNPSHYTDITTYDGYCWVQQIFITFQST